MLLMVLAPTALSMDVTIQLASVRNTHIKLPPAHYWTDVHLFTSGPSEGRLF